MIANADAESSSIKNLFINRVAVSVMFFFNGFLVASWVSRIPTIKEQLQLSESHLANALVFMTFGALLGFQLVGFTLSRYGSRTSTIGFALLSACFLPVIAAAKNGFGLAATLFLFGVVNGATDVAMNAQAIRVEKLYGKPIINSFHAIWSVGFFLSAVLGGRMAAMGYVPSQHFLMAAIFSLVVMLFFMQKLLPSPKETGGGMKFVLPPKKLLPIGFLALMALLGEGAMSDWSGVYLRKILKTSEAFATNGAAATAIAMIAARFSGDALVARFGSMWVVRFGGLVVALGMAAALTLGTVWASLIGFACVGMGLAIIFPLTLSAAANTPGVPEGIGLPSVSSMGYTGFFIGPVAIGYLAEVFSLRGSLGLLVILGLTTAYLANAMQPVKQSEVVIKTDV